MGGGNPAMDYYPIHTETRDKLRPDGPLDSNADLPYIQDATKRLQSFIAVQAKGFTPKILGLLDKKRF